MDTDGAVGLRHKTQRIFKSPAKTKRSLILLFECLNIESRFNTRSLINTG